MSILSVWLPGFLKCLTCLLLISPVRAVVGIHGILLSSFGLSFCFLPSSLQSLFAETWHLPNVLLSGCFAVLHGALFAIPIAFLLEAFPLTGRLVDSFRGAQFAEQYLAQEATSTTQLEFFMAIFGLLILFQAGAHFWFIEQIATRTFQVGLPLEEILQLLQEVFVFALTLVFPVMLFALLLDGFSGLAGRALGRVSLYFELLPMKMAVGAVIFGAVVLLSEWSLPSARPLKRIQEVMHNIKQN